MRPSLSKIDFSVLVDILSNAAGMMIMLACLALIIKQNQDTGKSQMRSTKPISFPLAYIPDKRSVTIVLKYNRLYQLPESEALAAVVEQAKTGKPVESLDLTKDGVKTRIEVTPTATGYRFLYKITPNGGIPLNQPAKIAETLRDMEKRYPPDHFFYVIHTWPGTFPAFTEIREFLHEQGVEVGWMPRSAHEDEDSNTYDIAYSIGEYSKDLSSIKAQ